YAKFFFLSFRSRSRGRRISDLLFAHVRRYPRRLAKPVLRKTEGLNMTRRPLFGALEFAGEKIIHHQRRDKSGHAKILLRVVVQHMQPKLVAAISEACKELVYGTFLFIAPLG